LITKGSGGGSLKRVWGERERKEINLATASPADAITVAKCGVSVLCKKAIPEDGFFT